MADRSHAERALRRLGRPVCGRPPMMLMCLKARGPVCGRACSFVTCGNREGMRQRKDDPAASANRPTGRGHLGISRKNAGSCGAGEWNRSAITLTHSPPQRKPLSPLSVLVTDPAVNAFPPAGERAP